MKTDDQLISEMSAEEAQNNLRLVMRRNRVYVNGEPWNEGFWFYRDHETGKLYSVPGFKPGLSVVLGGWRGLTVVGVAGGPDPKERNHAIGGEVICSLDKMGDFESMAERIQGKRL